MDERIGLQVVSGPVRDAIIKAVDLVPQQARAVAVKCARPLPSDSQLSVVWAKGIETPSGVPSSADRRVDFHVRAPFNASFTCERSSSRADCLPIRPLRLEFSSPVPPKWAERIVLVTPSGRMKPKLEQGRGETSEQLCLFRRRRTAQVSRTSSGRSKGEVSADPSESGVSAVEIQPAVSGERPAQHRSHRDCVTSNER